MALVTTMLTAIGSSGGGGGGSTPGVILSPVVAASTTALTVTYANGASGVGATLTNAGAQAAIQLDGVSPTVGQRVLIKDQASALQNGIYTVTVVGTGATNWVLTRATDFDEPGEMTAGVQVDVSAGTVNATTVWILSASVAAVGTNSVTFVAASDAGYTASRALVTNAAGRVVVATTTSTEIGFVNGVTSAIQTQLNTKLTGTAASQSDQETGTSTTSFVAPAVQQYHPSASKAWANFTGTGTPTLQGSYNFTSITDNGAGAWQLNFTVAMSNANFSAITVGDNSIASASTVVQSTATGSVSIRGVNFVTNTNVDLTNIYVVCFGDQ